MFGWINKDKIYRTFYFGLGIITIIVLMFYVLPNNHYTYYFNGDYLYQHVPFYTEFFRLADNGIPQWSWNLFLGGDFWASKSYYLIGDIYAWFSYIIDKSLNNVVYSMYLSLCLKYLASYSTFYLFISKRKLQPLYSFILSLMYSFSGWSILFIEQPVFISFYSLLPLLFYGLDRLFYDDKKLPFILSVALLVSTNFYLFWVSSLMLLFYYLFLYFNRSQRLLKDWLFTSLKILGYYLFGLLLTAFVWLPGLINISDNQRFGQLILNYNYYSISNLFSFILYTLIPRTYMYFGALNSGVYNFNQVSLYVGTLGFLLLPHYYFIQQSKKDRIKSSLILIILLALISSPYIGLLFHFTFSLRYTILHTFFILLMISEVLKNIQNLKTIPILIIQIIYIILWFIVKNHLDLSFKFEINNLYISLLMSLLFTVTILALSRKIKYQKFFEIALIILIISETYLINIPTMSQAIVDSSDVIFHYENSEFRDIVYSIKAKEDSFFRILFCGSGNNISNINDFHSIEAYDSTYNYSITNFLTWIGFQPTSSWIFDFYNSTNFKLLNVRYAIDLTKTDTGFYPDNYIYFNNSEYNVYHYLDSFMAYRFNQYSSYVDMNQFIEASKPELTEIAKKLEKILYFRDIPNNISDFMDENSPVESFNPTSYTNNTMTFDFDLNENQMYFFSIPNSDGWQAYDNDKVIEKYDVQGGFIGLLLSKGEHHIIFKYSTPGLKLGFMISTISWLWLIGFFIYKKSEKIFKQRH